MTDQITLEEALELVEFELSIQGEWRVKHVKSSVWGNVYGDVTNVHGDVLIDVWGNVWGNVGGNLGGECFGTISGHEWKFVETPREKLKRLIDEGANKEELLAVVHQLEDSDD